MNDDILFRSSIYGFNKEDVIDYIEKIKKELKEQIDIAKDKESQLSNSFDKINELEKKMLTQKQLVDELYFENSQYQSKLSSETQKKLSIVSDEKENTIDNNSELEKIKNENKILKNSVKQLQEECKSFKETEKRFGSMILDAYIYSESILEDARQKAQQIAKGTQSTIDEATGDIGEFSLCVNNISEGFSKIVSELTHDIKNITENLVSVTKKIQQQNSNENDKHDLPDINTYINDFKSNESNDIYKNIDLSENIRNFDNYIKKFDTMISDDIKNVDKQELKQVPLEEAQDKLPIEDFDDKDDSKELSSCNQLSNEDLINTANKVNKLIDKYVSFDNINSKSDEFDNDKDNQIDDSDDVLNTIISYKNKDIETISNNKNDESDKDDADLLAMKDDLDILESNKNEINYLTQVDYNDNLNNNSSKEKNDTIINDYKIYRIEDNKNFKKNQINDNSNYNIEIQNDNKDIDISESTDESDLLDENKTNNELSDKKSNRGSGKIKSIKLKIKEDK